MKNITNIINPFALFALISTESQINVIMSIRVLILSDWNTLNYYLRISNKEMVSSQLFPSDCLFNKNLISSLKARFKKMVKKRFGILHISYVSNLH